MIAEGAMPPHMLRRWIYEFYPIANMEFSLS
jgi:hypothetical protein